MNFSSSSIKSAAQALRAGTLVAFPTETVYGLGANACDDKAVASIFALKGRPSFNPLIVHMPSLVMAAEYVELNTRAETLAQHFLPGPLTLVLKRKSACAISLLASAGLETVAVRIPAHPIARALLAEASIPIAAPSANRSGRISPTQAAHVRDEFGDTLTILDGGACQVGIESTVIDISGPRAILLRPGAITHEMLQNALQEEIQAAQEENAIASPGMLASHYAPLLPVRLHATHAEANEALLGFGPNVPIGGKRMLNLSPTGDMVEAAANLFAYLRLLDNSNYTRIAIMPIPDTGLGVAINDRLKRAAAPR